MTDYNLLADYIAQTYIARISGKDLGDRVVGYENIDRVMSGKLAANRVEETFDGGYREADNNQKFESVASVSVTFLVNKTSTGSLHVIPQGMLFYTVQPEYEEICSYFIQKYSRIDRTDYKDIVEVIANHEEDKVVLPQVYSRLQIADLMGEGIELPVSTMNPGTRNLENDITDKLNKAADKIIDEVRIMPDQKVPISILKTASEFETNCAPKEERVRAYWDIDIQVMVSETDQDYRVSLMMVNKTQDSGQVNVGYEPEIFNAGIRVVGDETVRFDQIRLDYFRTSFKDRRPIYAMSENTAVRYIPEKNEIQTDNIPVYYQPRTKTKDELTKYVTFAKLISDPVANLTLVSDHMKSDLAERQKEFLACRASLSESAQREFEKALRDYEQEIIRFRYGIEQIRTKEKVRKAFILTNQTFALQIGNTKSYAGWRLFQIVFIVSLICEVIRSEYPHDDTPAMLAADEEAANLLYFPTGGGKTEAFLGIVVFDLFFDRLRGKEEGVTAILKYPLRLLAVQQLDRVLTIIMKANMIRLQVPDLKDTHEFALGFYVGSSNTPNKITSKERLSGRGSRNNNNSMIVESDPETLTEYYCFIDTCPVCGKKSVRVRFNKDRWTLEHHCTNPDCQVDALPLMIVDEEIYRYLPSVIVSTIDKMAAVGLNARFKTLFGQVKAKCPIHGYSVSDKCQCGTECRLGMIPVSRLKDPAPTLFIQDEMHLVNESLGTFDAHYEAFLHYYAANLLPEEQRKKVRYIGATATISMYEDHIRNLYNMQGRRFPCVYPSRRADENFYSYIDPEDITRIIMGYAPYGRSIIDGVWESAYQMRLLVYGLMQNPIPVYKELEPEGFTGSVGDLKDMLNDYWIQLIYNNRKDDVMNLSNSFENQANNHLEELKVPHYQIEAMTSDVDFQTVRKTLFDINANRGQLEKTNLLLATSTISHGVDEDSFNIMYFFGIPKNNAEYIQAYSRIGRRYTGIAIDIIRLMRLRDRSYLKNFIVFHENKDDLVEMVPINRWARNAVYSTLPGLLSALVYQYYEPTLNDDSLYRTVNIQKHIQDGSLTAEDCIEQLIKIYGCCEEQKQSLIYVDSIRQEITNIFDGIANGVFDREEYFSNAIIKFDKGHREPMTSLRDTEEQLEIRLD